MSVELEYKHNVHSPEWTAITWPYKATTIEAARAIAEELADDWVDEDYDDPDRNSIYDDIQIRVPGGKELAF